MTSSDTPTHLSEAGGVSTDLLLVENLFADVELALARDDIGWRRLEALGNGLSLEGKFTEQGRKRAIALAEVMAVVNPLIKRGLNLRVAYIWGDGVSIQVKENDPLEDYLNEFIERSETTFLGQEAIDDHERNGFGIAGEVIFALPTDPDTGRVDLRTIKSEEITKIIYNPDDYADPWFYLREWTSVSLDGKTTNHKELYPSLDYQPPAEQRRPSLNGLKINWNTPLLFKTVNRPRRSDRGVGDSFSAIPWARMYKDFLESWAILMKALSRYAFKRKTRPDKVNQAAARIQQAVDRDVVGATHVSTTNDDIEAIPKTGATVDANSGQPIAVMVAAAFDVPITELLGDPGVTGARAVAETLRVPTEAMIKARRRLWTSIIKKILDYVVDQAIKAQGTSFSGTVDQDGNTQRIILAGKASRLVEVHWPELDSVPLDQFMKALQLADSLDVVPPGEVLKMVLKALGVEDPSAVLATVITDAGFKRPHQFDDQSGRTDGEVEPTESTGVDLEFALDEAAEVLSRLQELVDLGKRAA